MFWASTPTTLPTTLDPTLPQLRRTDRISWLNRRVGKTLVDLRGFGFWWVWVTRGDWLFTLTFAYTRVPVWYYSSDVETRWRSSSFLVILVDWSYRLIGHIGHWTLDLPLKKRSEHEREEKSKPLYAVLSWNEGGLRRAFKKWQAVDRRLCHILVSTRTKIYGPSDSWGW